MAWLAGWTKRVKLTIDSGDITAALEDFPVLIYLSTSSGINGEDVTFVFDEVGANSLKIAVTKDDGETECYVEVEKWDNGNGKAWLWVKIPNIASGADTDIYLYYDNTHTDNVAHVGATNSAVAEAVWDAKFEFVCHMRDDPDNTAVRDSTSNDNDGAKEDAGEPAITTTGQIDGAQVFDESDDYVTLGNATFLSDIKGTVSMWVKKTTSTINRSPWGSSDLSSGVRFFYPIVRLGATNNVSLVHYDGGYNYALDTPNNSYPDDNAQRLLTFTSDGTTIKIYINGVNQNLVADQGANNGDWFGDLTGIDLFTLGELWYNTNVHADMWGGEIDEVRISNDERNSAWVKATFETGRDHLLDWGGEEVADSEDLYCKFEVSVKQDGSAELSGEFIVRSADSEELLGEFIAQQADSEELLGDFVVRHIGTPVELLTEFIIQQASSETLLGKFIIQQSDSETLLGKFIIQQSDSETLLGKFIIQQSDSETLLCGFITQQASSEELLGEFIARHKDEEQLKASFDSQVTEDLLGEFIAQHTDSEELKAGFDGQVTEDLKAGFWVRYYSVDLFCKFYVRPEGSMATDFEIKDLTRGLTIHDPDRVMTVTPRRKMKVK